MMETDLVVSQLEQLEKDGFIQELPEKIVVNISLVSLCQEYGPVKGEQFSKLLNKYLSHLEHKMGYKIEGGWNGGLSVVYTLRRKSSPEPMKITESSKK